MNRYLKRFLMITGIACCASSSTQAIPAYPRRIKITTSCDSFYLTMRGDENCKFAITTDGYTALQDSTGWYYASSSLTGETVKSNYRVCSEKMKDGETKSFLATLQKGLMPTVLPKDGMTHSVRSRISDHNNVSDMRSDAKIGNRKALVILMQYSDLKFRKTKEEFHRLFNEKG